MELIRFLVPDVLSGRLMDSLSGRAMSAAGKAVSFLLDGEEPNTLPPASTTMCAVIKAQKPGS